MAEPDFYLNSDDHYDFSRVRECAIVQKFKHAQYGYLMLKVLVEPPVIDSSSIGQKMIRKNKVFILGPHFEGDSMDNINEYPFYVNICRPLQDTYGAAELALEDFQFVTLGQIIEKMPPKKTIEEYGLCIGNDLRLTPDNCLVVATSDYIDLITDMSAQKNNGSPMLFYSINGDDVHSITTLIELLAAYTKAEWELGNGWYSLDAVLREWSRGTECQKFIILISNADKLTEKLGMDVDKLFYSIKNINASISDKQFYLILQSQNIQPIKNALERFNNAIGDF